MNELINDKGRYRAARAAKNVNTWKNLPAVWGILAHGFKVS